MANYYFTFSDDDGNTVAEFPAPAADLDAAIEFARFYQRAVEPKLGGDILANVERTDNLVEFACLTSLNYGREFAAGEFNNY